jgi:hypothetical protein
VNGVSGVSVCQGIGCVTAAGVVEVRLVWGVNSHSCGEAVKNGAPEDFWGFMDGPTAAMNGEPSLVLGLPNKI